MKVVLQDSRKFVVHYLVVLMVPVVLLLFWFTTTVHAQIKSASYWYYKTGNQLWWKEVLKLGQ